MGEEKPKTFEDIIIEGGNKREAEELAIKSVDRRKLSAETIESSKEFLRKKESEKEKVQERKSNLEELKKRKEAGELLSMKEQEKSPLEKEEKQKTSETLKNDLAGIKEEIKNREIEKQKAKKSVGMFHNLSARFSFSKEKRTAEKERRGTVQIELEKAEQGIKGTEGEYNDLIREYGSLLAKEGMPKGEALVKMMEQRNQLEKERLQQAEENKGKFMKVVDKYNKLPLKYKIAITAGLVGGGIATGMAGGSAAIAGSLVLGSAKVFESVAAGVGAGGIVEHFGKKKEEKLKKGAMEEMQAKAKKGGDLANLWKVRTAELEEQIEKSRRNKTIAKWAVGTGVGVGTFLLSGGHKDFANAWKKSFGAKEAVFGAGENIVKKESQQVAEKTGAKGMEESGKFSMGAGTQAGGETAKETIKEAGKEAVKAGEKAAGKSFEEVAKKGDSVWKMIKRQVSSNPEFSGLENAEQKANVIDTIRRKIASNPDAFGLKGVKDIDKINIGQKLDLSSIFTKGSNAAAGTEKNLLGKMVEHAKGLSPEKIANIQKNLAEAVKKGINKNAEVIQKGIEGLKISAAEKLKIAQPANSVWSRLVGQSDKGFFAENLSKIGECKSFFAKQEWGRWKNMDVSKILSSSFENEKGVRLLEKSHRQSFARFLKMLRRAVPPLAGKKETVFEYLTRAQSALK